MMCRRLEGLDGKAASSRTDLALAVILTGSANEWCIMGRRSMACDE